MNEELQLDIKEIKNKITIISDSVFTLAKLLPKSLQNQVLTSLSENEEPTNLGQDGKETINQVNNSSPPPSPSLNSKYIVDYSYIDAVLYPAWKSNLEKYNKDMVNFASKSDIINFCYCATKSIESAIEILFENAFNNLSQENRLFLDAYERVKSFYEKQTWDIPQIYVNIEDCQEQDIDNGIIKILQNDRCISFREITMIRHRNLAAAIEICMYFFKKDFLDDKDLKEKYFFIKNTNKLRKIEAHGSSKDIGKRIKDINNYNLRKLYYSNSNYIDINNTVYWFISTVYEKISS